MARPAKKGKVQDDKSKNKKKDKKEAKAKIKALKAKRKELMKGLSSLVEDFLEASSKEEYASFATKAARRESDEKREKKFGGIEMRFNNKAGTLRDRALRELHKMADHERKIVKAKLSA